VAERRAKVVFWPTFGFRGAGRATIGALFVASVLAGTFGAPAVASALLTLAMGVAVAFGVARAAWRIRARRAPADAVVAADGADLLVGSARDGTRERVRVLGRDLTSGYIVPEADGAARVVLFRGPIPAAHVTFADIDSARELLGELGLSPLERPVTFAFFFGLRVTVGIDGVLVAWPLLGRRRFVRHGRIDDIRWTEDEVTLVLTSGRRITIATNPSADRLGDGREKHRALVERLLAAREAYASAAAGESLAALARQGRSAEAWVRELRASSEAAGGQYRTASLPAEALWRVALDPTEKDELRIGAGLALRPTLDGEGKERLRVAAAASASPKLRVALVAAAEEEDDEAVARVLGGERADGR
jgi:hypothetical protein